MSDYLTWFKNRSVVIDQQLQQHENTYNLMGSAVMEPTALFTHLIQHHESDLMSVLATSSFWGHPRLMSMIAQIYCYPVERIAITSGVSSGIYLLSRVLLEPGDHCIVETPAYEPFVAVPRFVGARVSRVPRRPQIDGIDPEALAVLVTPQTKFILLSNLHNPGMTVLTDGLILEILGHARKRSPSVKLIIDEIFHDFIYHQQSTSAALDESIITMNGLGKVYGMGMLHCGWILAASEVIQRVREVQTVVDGGGTRLTESFATLVLEHRADYEVHWRELSVANLKLVRAFWEPLVEEGLLAGSVPEIGSVLFPHFRAVQNSTEMQQFIDYLRDNFHVFVVPGIKFDAPIHFRIGTMGATQPLEIGLARLAKGIREYACSKATFRFR